MTLRNLLKTSLPFLNLALLLGAVFVLAVISAPLLRSDTNLAAVSASEVFSLTNDERSDEGVTTLKRNALLDQAAQMKAQDMAAKGYYAHVSPEGLTPMHWVENAGYRYLIIGENLVVNRTDAEQVVDAFMGSPGHRANILRKDFTEIGVGVANGIYKGKDATFAVQIFAAPYPTKVVDSSKENVKQSSSVSKVTQAPIPPKPSILPDVPRASVPSVPAQARATSTLSVPNPDSIQEKVKVLIQPLAILPQTSSTSATSTISTTTFPVPSFLLSTSAPIELAGVSRLEADTLPVPIGSSWSMEFRSFVEGLATRFNNLFSR